MFHALISAFLPASSDFTRNQIQQKVLAYAIAPPILQTHVIDNWWGVLYPPPALSGGVMPEENSKSERRFRL